jgi:hypothetical protein
MTLRTLRVYRILLMLLTIGNGILALAWLKAYVDMGEAVMGVSFLINLIGFGICAAAVRQNYQMEETLINQQVKPPKDPL